MINSKNNERVGMELLGDVDLNEPEDTRSNEEVLAEIEASNEQPEVVSVKEQQERDMWRLRKAGTSLELC